MAHHWIVLHPASPVSALAFSGGLYGQSTAHSECAKQKGKAAIGPTLRDLALFVLLILDHLVRQLVSVARLAGKMFAQNSTHLLNRVHDCSSEFSLAEMAFHGLNHFMPEIVSAFFMDSDVTHNGERLRFGS
jgi:hypothetical protein